MDKTKFADGKTFKKMFSVGTYWLEQAVPDINAINVFPVPDGDTGTNMLLTMRSAVEEAGTLNGEPVGIIARSMAYGALMGARGNSGVILSQFWRGFADALEGKETLDGPALAAALSRATSTAYGGLVHPVEGTILTVLRSAAEAAITVAEEENSGLLDVLEAAVQAARHTVANTPELLPVLKEAGVVDAGAQGLYVLLDGALSSLNGRGKDARAARPDLVSLDIEPLRIVSANTQVEIPYGYCTNFVLQGKNLDVEKISKKLQTKGQSLVVSADGSAHVTMVRVHIHTFKPGEIIDFASRLGTLHQIEIHNMDDQYEDFIKLQRSKLPQVDTAIVTIASGDGMFDVFNSLGATIVVPGGQTMNPSVRQILQAVDHAPSDRVILLPNNKNIVLTADEVRKLSTKEVHVVPSRTVPQGIAALLAFNYDLGVEENAKSMGEALQSVTTIEIARAVRKSEMSGTKIRKGQFIAIKNDKELVAADDDLTNAVLTALNEVKAAEAELVTLYWGSDIEAGTAESVANQVRERYGIEVELVNGGQPHYDFIISVE
ncbi:MAG: DAK2 domain-containing protein [Dehalococcoidia bacterium]|nr:DAK2 domain-containing protein [Dehalococcoidia bacterium]